MPSFRYAASLTTPELGMIVIGLNSFAPLDHGKEHEELRDRLTRVYAERDPEGYRLVVLQGDVQRFVGDEHLWAKQIA